MSIVKSLVRETRHYINRNHKTIDGKRLNDNRICLEWWSGSVNVGDVLSKVIFDWMIQEKGLDLTKEMAHPKHVMCIGSIIGMGYFDAVVWGSGIHRVENIKFIYKQRLYRKYDVRAVRGPVTENILMSMGYESPGIYGDPAVLMPMIYTPALSGKKYNCSVILHYLQKKNEDFIHREDVHYIDVETENYKYFIDEIVQSKLVISSSLHGIILAESYGVPAIFLRAGMKEEEMKFFDWYLSTGRKTIKLADSIDEAILMDPMDLPELNLMRNNLLKTFPVDLWKG